MPTTSNINISTVITWLLYLVPIYIFLIVPGLRVFFPATELQTKDVSPVFGRFEFDDEADYDQLVPGLRVEDDSFISPEEDLDQLNCREDDYRVHIFSHKPLIIYVENFFTDAEADHLVTVRLAPLSLLYEDQWLIDDAFSETKWLPSIISDGTTERVDPSIRRSDRALLDRDNVVRCAEERARAFQGWRPWLYIERMWTQRYNASGHYRHHYDWRGSAAHRGGDRLSTFMVYLDANCTGGGTNFPRLRMPRKSQWCRFIECDDGPTEGTPYEGVTFKPIKGNAIFWENLRPDGTGYPETWHAALPVLSGTKVGLNIWSWYQPPVRGG